MAVESRIQDVRSRAVQPVVTNFSDALWWSATLVAANELGERPATPEGRVLALALAVFGMGPAPTT